MFPSGGDVRSANEAVAVDRDEAAKLLSISVRMLDQLTKDGEIPSFKWGRRRLYCVAKLRAVVMARSA